MGYKKIKQNLGFADLALASSLEHNRSIKLMEKNTDVYPFEFEDYSTGAYLPLLLFKCLMLQKWFHIDSDPELENQIYPVK